MLIVVGHIYRNTTHYADERTGKVLCGRVKTGGTMPVSGTEATCKVCQEKKAMSESFWPMPVNDLSQGFSK